uniref:Mitochondrial pyruvate dehydrogenase E1 component subunit alpha n=1 Tax=Thraustochytrium sp. LLF1b TaxID=1112570 RepID=A0A455ZB55_9STRA|nr:TPA_exp: mitochondrial pyruvate dehydrogenase E1 component subunit alpha [Thraustochytrium sp. LLF1b]
MDVLSVREGLKFIKEHCSTGKGPMFCEIRTYRYHGHSMSDPGVTYRTRDEVNEVRQSRDPIENVKNRLLQVGWATEAELKETEKEVRGEIAAALKAAKASSQPDLDELFTDIYTTGKPHASGWHSRLESEFPPEVRMPDLVNNRHFK